MVTSHGNCERQKKKAIDLGIKVFAPPQTWTQEYKS